jgi:hypothetical protein
MGCLLDVEGDLAEVSDRFPPVLTEGAFDETMSSPVRFCVAVIRSTIGFGIP